MLVKLKSFYRTFFPARQLLIRQNGEVKHLVLAPWVQLTTLLVILTAIVWLTFRHYKSFLKLTRSPALNKPAYQTARMAKTALSATSCL